jgi:hypothetical protein
MYAVMVAVISGLEVVLFRHAHRHGTTLAVGIWFLGIPFGILANRWKPADADRFFPS